jgi:dihydroorotate dehydrogenase (fumarate)
MNLAVDYLGLRLASPFVIGASPCCDNVQVARQLEDVGAGAVVMRSLFAEQLQPPPAPVRLQAGAGDEDGLDAYPDVADYQVGPDQYLRQIELLKRHLRIPVIASLNGHQPGAWMDFAVRAEQAGADAIELNFYQVVADPAIDAEQVETGILQAVGLVADSVKLPVAVKLSPFHAALAQLAVALELEGAAGLVLFNRFFQPDVNVEELTVHPLLRLSDPQELLLRLRWLAILAPQVRLSLAASGGVYTATGAAKALLTGAHAVQLVSAVLKHGPKVVDTLQFGLEQWMRDHGYGDIATFRGLLDSRRSRDAGAFERANYIRTLQTWRV